MLSMLSGQKYKKKSLTILNKTRLSIFFITHLKCNMLRSQTFHCGRIIFEIGLLTFEPPLQLFGQIMYHICFFSAQMTQSQYKCSNVRT